MQYLIVGLAVAGVLAISTVIGLNMMGKGQKPVAEKPKETGEREYESW